MIYFWCATALAYYWVQCLNNVGGQGFEILGQGFKILGQGFETLKHLFPHCSYNFLFTIAKN